MSNITLFQCIPAYRSWALIRLIATLHRSNCEILLDVEDSIQELNEPDITRGLKLEARKTCIHIFDAFPGDKFYLRVNKTDSPEFNNDCELIRLNPGSIKGIFIPKVESPNDIRRVTDLFGARFIICIIIETLKGFRNAEIILSEKYAAPVEYVFFGNYDYHLDAGFFPIREQRTDHYWNLICPLINLIEKKGFRFGNSPYARIGDLEGLQFICNQLNNYCKNSFALVSLHKDQTKVFQKLISGKLSASDFATEYEKEYISLETYSQFKQKGRSFAYDQSHRLITPHEYQLMLKYQIH